MVICHNKSEHETEESVRAKVDAACKGLMVQGSMSAETERSLREALSTSQTYVEWTSRGAGINLYILESVLDTTDACPLNSI